MAFFPDITFLFLLKDYMVAIITGLSGTTWKGLSSYFNTGLLALSWSPSQRPIYCSHQATAKLWLLIREMQGCNKAKLFGFPLPSLTIWSKRVNNKMGYEPLGTRNLTVYAKRSQSTR